MDWASKWEMGASCHGYRLCSMSSSLIRLEKTCPSGGQTIVVVIFRSFLRVDKMWPFVFIKWDSNLIPIADIFLGSGDCEVDADVDVEGGS